MAAAWLLRENDSQQSLVETSGMVVDPQVRIQSSARDFIRTRLSAKIKDNKSGQIKLDQSKARRVSAKARPGGWRVAIIHCWTS